jgi:multiple sugar transport system substrate-binding protein
MSVTRRDVIAATAGLAGAGLIGPAPTVAQQGAAPGLEPERGAELSVLRWASFVKGDQDQFLGNTQKFIESTGVKVQVDEETFDDIGPRAKAAANAGSGPDIMVVSFDDPFQYPDKLVDLTDLGRYLGDRYGGWYPGLEAYAKTRDGRFITLPFATIGQALLYRESWVSEAGFTEFPKDAAGLLELCKALKAKGHPAGFAHGRAVGDGNDYAHWLVWGHGGRMVDENGKVVIDSPETLAALRFAREMYQMLVPGTETWLDISNNRAYLAGDISLTNNGISLYYSAKNNPKLADLARDTRAASWPTGPVGTIAALHRPTSAIVFKHTNFPKAAKAYLRFLFEEPQMNAWLSASSAYFCQSLRAYAKNPVWTADPNHAAFAKASETLRPNGYSGPLGPASAAVLAEFVMVDMVAEAATGQKSPEEAAQRAAERAKRHYGA